MNYINDFYNRLNNGDNPKNISSSDLSRDMNQEGVVEDFDEKWR